MTKVTICVPVYNVERYIERCIRSICEQTLEDLEIILINDCSPDRSWEILKSILKEYPNRTNKVKLLENTQNVGPGVSRQRCAQIASGEYIYFADSDDWLEPEMLEMMYIAAIENQADIVGCQVNFITRDRIQASNFLSNFSHQQWISTLIMPSSPSSVPIALWSRLIRKSVYVKTFESESELQNLVRFEDFLNIVKCHYFANKVYWIDKPLYNHDRTNMNSVLKTNDIKSVESSIRVASLLESFFKRRKISTYDFEISYFKTYAKNLLIISDYVFDPIRWRELWPELKTHPKLPQKVKILMYLAENGHITLLKSIKKIYKITKLYINFFK